MFIQSKHKPLADGVSEQFKCRQRFKVQLYIVLVIKLLNSKDNTYTAIVLLLQPTSAQFELIVSWLSHIS